MHAIYPQRVPFEGPGAFATTLTNQVVSVERYLAPRDGLPNDGWNLLIVMGGAMSVNK